MNNIEKNWNEFHSELLNYIRKRVKNHQDADDIFQDAFSKIYKNIDSINSPKAIKTWLYRITSNTIVDYYRTEKQYEELDYDIELKKENNEDFKELSKCVNVFITRLPSKFQQAFKFTDIQGHSQIELAHKESISIPGAKSRP